MAVQPSYPGVYIEELPSSVHTIMGVPTSIAAFVGTAYKGPVSRAVAIGSPTQYERIFGRMDTSPLAVAVKLYFQNGGAQAVVVRVVAQGLKPATASLPQRGGDPSPKLTATSPGAWGVRLGARVDITERQPPKTYTLTLRDLSPGGRTERYTVSTEPNNPHTLERVLKASSLATVDTDDQGANPLAMPAAHAAVPRGEDPFTYVPRDTPQPTATPSPPAPPTPPVGDGGALPPPPPPTPRPASPRTPPAPQFYSPFVLEGTPRDQSIDNVVDKVPDDGDYAPTSQEGGIFALTEHDAFFNMLIMVPPGPDDLSSSLLAQAAKIAFDKRAFMIVDPPRDWNNTEQALNGRDTFLAEFDEPSRRNSALYFPRVRLDDLGHTASPTIDVTSFPPAAAIAGLYARTDTDRGIWKAPAGLATGIGGTLGLTDVLTDFDSGQLNPVAINALRTLPIVGNVVWGARTLVGADIEASQWKYVPVRRLALYIEESLYRGTQWVVFEPNDEPLWAQIRLNVGAFMHTLYRQGAFQGQNARDAYFVKCDKDTNPQADIDRGIVNIVVGFAPLKPAEFVIIQLQQISPQLEV